MEMPDSRRAKFKLAAETYARMQDAQAEMERSWPEETGMPYMGDYLPQAREFLDQCQIEPTPDAVAQLAEVFVPCLQIMAERGYDDSGATWQSNGYMGQL